MLGGTTEASQTARHLSDAGIAGVFSYAGRTAAPVGQPLPVRVGGFGGVDGLAGYIRDHGISHVVDATHPFAAQISANAVAACRVTGTPLVAVQRPEWRAGPGDDWCHVPDIAGAVDALPDRSARVFLAIGRQNLAPFAARGHHYLLRLVDAPDVSPLPDCHIDIARGPFTVAGDRDLMQRHGITHLVAKNAGGTGAVAKLTAARDLGVRVVMIDRPFIPPRPVVDDPGAVIAWLHQSARRGV